MSRVISDQKWKSRFSFIHWISVLSMFFLPWIRKLFLGEDKWRWSRYLGRDPFPATILDERLPGIETKFIAMLKFFTDSFSDHFRWFLVFIFRLVGCVKLIFFWNIPSFLHLLHYFWVTYLWKNFQSLIVKTVEIQFKNQKFSFDTVRTKDSCNWQR